MYCTVTARIRLQTIAIYSHINYNAARPYDFHLFDNYLARKSDIIL